MARFFVISSLIFGLAFVGCGSGSMDVTQISGAENPVEQINQLDRALSESRKNHLNSLSPSWFSKAEAYLRQAKDYRKRGKRADSILESVARGKASLKKAQVVSRLAKTAIPKAIKAREDALRAGAARFTREYGETEAEFLDLTRAIESNDLREAQSEESNVATKYRHLELQAIRESTLGEVERLISKSRAMGAEQITPKSLAKAERALDEADEFVSKHRYNKEQVRDKAERALFHARRLRHLTREGLQVQKMRPEAIVLWIETMLHRIGSKAGAPDMRDQPFPTQVKNIDGSVFAVKADHKFLAEETKVQKTQIAKMKERIASLEGRTREEQAAKERLETRQKFLQLFGTVRASYSSREADVYRRGEQLLIRLKSIDFPVGKHLIMPENYSILSKVQQSIRVFGEPRVVIEGHTDSTGSESLNEHLSQRRAEAVRDYFLANRTLPPKKIMAVGYGSERPVASNKTAKGRALNRRIDIVIEPRKK